MVEYRKATAQDLEEIWDYQIETNPGDPNWIRWKKSPDLRNGLYTIIAAWENALKDEAEI